jgi:hypothetical protein
MSDQASGNPAEPDDDAPESDRLFFEEHPHRTLRLRKMRPRELPNNEPNSFVLVQQLIPGIRLRTRLAADGIALSLLSDAQIDGLFSERKLREMFGTAHARLCKALKN